MCENLIKNHILVVNPEIKKLVYVREKVHDKMRRFLERTVHCRFIEICKSTVHLYIHTYIISVLTLSNCRLSDQVFLQPLQLKYQQLKAGKQCN